MLLQVTLLFLLFPSFPATNNSNTVIVKTSEVGLKLTQFHLDFYTDV
jgi:hypothetical protein